MKITNSLDTCAVLACGLSVFRGLRLAVVGADVLAGAYRRMKRGPAVVGVSAGIDRHIVVDCLRRSVLARGPLTVRRSEHFEQLRIWVAWQRVEANLGPMALAESAIKEVQAIRGRNGRTQNSGTRFPSRSFARQGALQAGLAVIDHATDIVS
jgi:hypothetical protein